MSEEDPASVAPKSRLVVKPWHVFGVFGAIIAVAVIVSVLTGGDERQQRDAADYCERQVTSRLKAPSSAEFATSTVSVTNEGEYTVDGAVDAQNTFGATIRSFYTCTIEDTDGAWRLVDLDIND